MARATPSEESPAEEMVQSAGEAMLMMVPGYVWETLVRQAEAETERTGSKVTPGTVLDRALRSYMEGHGEPEAVSYLHSLAQGGR